MLVTIAACYNLVLFWVSDSELYSIQSRKVLVTIAACYDHVLFYVSESELYSIHNTVHKTFPMLVTVAACYALVLFYISDLRCTVFS